MTKKFSRVIWDFFDIEMRKYREQVAQMQEMVIGALALQQTLIDGSC